MPKDFDREHGRYWAKDGPYVLHRRLADDGGFRFTIFDERRGLAVRIDDDATQARIVQRMKDHGIRQVNVIDDDR